jgi:hypothetical protein
MKIPLSIKKLPSLPLKKGKGEKSPPFLQQFSSRGYYKHISPSPHENPSINKEVTFLTPQKGEG